MHHMIVKVKVNNSMEPMPDSLELEGTAAALLCALIKSCIENVPADCTAKESLQATMDRLSVLGE